MAGTFINILVKHKTRRRGRSLPAVALAKEGMLRPEVEKIMIKNKQPNRHSIRLPDYDYRLEGYYYVTICSKNHRCIFGEIKENIMCLNKLGYVANRCWSAIPDHFPFVDLDFSVVMPNHMHGILIIDDSGLHLDQDMQSLRPRVLSKSLASIIRSYKASVTKRIREDELDVSSFRAQHAAPLHQDCDTIDNLPARATMLSVWQRNYYEHVIRNEKSLYAIREYIENNPLKWDLDELNPYR